MLGNYHIVTRVYRDHLGFIGCMGVYRGYLGYIGVVGVYRGCIGVL